MKILFVQKEGGIFGAENYQLKIIPALLKKGFTIHFLRLYTDYQGGKGGRFIEILNSYRIQTFEINIGRLINPLNLIRINAIIKENGYNLVHCHLIHADLHLALVKMLLNRKLKLVSTKHGYDNAFTAKHGFNADKQKLTPYFVLSRFAEKRMLKSFTVTNSLRNFFVKTGLTSSDKMSTIHYGFDFQPPDVNWKDPKFRFFEKQIVIAGRLVRFKGHRFVIEALAILIKKYPKTGLVIVGSGEMESELKSYAEACKVSDHVVFTGYSTEVVRWMYNADIVSVPSISEGFGVVFLEAFNCSKPVVAFDVPAGNELLEHGKTGMLVRPFDIQELASVFGSLFENPVYSDKLGEAANKKLKTYFNLERMVNETVEFYNSIR